MVKKLEKNRENINTIGKNRGKSENQNFHIVSIDTDFKFIRIGDTSAQRC